jgi:hypothetical protein
MTNRLTVRDRPTHGKNNKLHLIIALGQNGNSYYFFKLMRRNPIINTTEKSQKGSS